MKYVLLIQFSGFHIINKSDRLRGVERAVSRGKFLDSELYLKYIQEL